MVKESVPFKHDFVGCDASGRLVRQRTESGMVDGENTVTEYEWGDYDD